MKETSEWTEENICCTGLVTFLNFFPLCFFFIYYYFIPLFNKNSDVVLEMLTLFSPDFFFFNFFFGIMSLLLIKLYGKVNSGVSL